MSKENTKSPLKVYENSKEENKTLKYLTEGRDGDLLIRGAYMSAKAATPGNSWMNILTSGVNAYGAQITLNKANEKATRDANIGEIQTYIDDIYSMDGSLDETYFDQAYDYTEKLRKDYIAAIDSGNKKEQLKIKGQLNAFSQSIQTIKTDVTEAAGMWKEDMLINNDGLTDEQASISKSILNGKNAVLDPKDGTWKWRAYDKDGKEMFTDEVDENGKPVPKYYTAEDLKNALPLRDDETSLTYKENSKKVIENAKTFREEGGTGFDESTSYKSNLELIKDDNIQSMMWDDITGYGSFVESLNEHPHFQNIFDILNTDEAGLKVSPASIAFIDENGDGHVDFRDFLDDETKQLYGLFDDNWDENDDNIIDGEEMEDMMTYLNSPEGQEDLQLQMSKNPKLKDKLEAIAKEKLTNAITKTDNKNFNVNTSKRLVADFLTNRQKQMFYGDKKSEVTINGVDKVVPTYQVMVPNVPGSLVTIGTSRSKGTKGQLLFGEPPMVINTIEELVENGGNYGYMYNLGWRYKWDDKKQKGTWSHIKTNPFPVGGKYNVTKEE